MAAVRNAVAARHAQSETKSREKLKPTTAQNLDGGS